MENISHLLSAAAQLGALEALKVAGVTAAEISENQAKKVYGKWFVEAVKARALQPCRIGAGKTGKRVYNISDIVAYKAEHESRADLANI